jgi:hypothetical protein
MSNCNDFRGINKCGMTLPGLKTMWIIPFGDIHDYTYTNDNLDKITNYKLNLLPTQYRLLPESASFAGVWNDGAARNFKHSLTATFPLLNEDSREEFERLLQADLSLIFKDRNGKCWLMGQDIPVRITKYEFTTSSTTGENYYTIDIEGTSKEQIREIQCYDGECFGNFNATELRKSSFVLNDASTIDYSGLYQMTADTTLLTYLPLQDLDPTNWSNPTILAQDQLTITNLIGAYPASDLVIELIYDSGLDIAYINLYSSDTTFNNLTFNTTSFMSDVTITLNIAFVLAPGLDLNTTQINVADDMAVDVYEGFVGDVLSGWIGVTGVTENAFIDVSTLYPSGTTLTLTVLGNDQCETKEFTYVTEDYSICDSTTTSQIVEGARYSVTFNEFNTGFEFREMQFYYDGIVIQLYKDASLFHSSFGQFQTDLLNQLYQFQTDIDVPTVTFSESTKQVTITFNSASTDALCYVKVWGNEDNGTQFARVYKATKSVLAEIQTATTSETIQFIDINSDELSGTNGNTPSINTGFITEPTLSTTGNIDSIAFDLLFAETDAITQNIISTSCPNQTNDILFTECFNEDTISDYGTLVKFTMQRRDLGEFWELTTTDATVPFTIPNSLYPNEQYNDFCYTIKTDVSPTVRFDILSMWYDNAAQLWYFEAIIDSTNTFISLEATDFSTVSTLIDSYYVENHTIDPLMHPQIGVIHTIPTIDAANTLITRAGNLKDALVETQQYNIPLVLTHYYTGTGFLDLTILQLNNAVNGAWYFEFCGTENGVAFLTYTITQPTLTDTFDFDTDLAAVGKTISDINGIRIKNNVGWVINLFYTPYNLLDIDYTLNCPQLDFTMIGKYSNFNLMTRLQNQAIVPDVTSFLCPYFKPSDLGVLCSSYAKIDQYISSDFVGFDSGLTTNTVQYTNVITPSAVTGLEVGQFIGFDTSTPTYWYQIIDITGGDVTLNQNILETNLTGTIVYIAVISAIPSSFNGNSWYSLSTISPIVWNKLNGYPTMTKPKDDFFGLFSVVDTDPAKLAFICLVKEVATHDEHIFTHRDNITPTLIDCRVNNSGSYKMESDNGTGTPAQVTAGTSTAYSLVQYSFTQATNSTTVRASLNGGTVSVDTQTKTGSFASGVQTFGGYFDGTDFQNGYAGEMVEIILLNDDTQSNIDKCIGYLAWKYDLVAQLDAGFTYKTFRP